MNISGVYIITNTINNKCYIGSSCNIMQRWKGKYNQHLTRAFMVYGKENFTFDILCLCRYNKSELLYFEQLCIDLFKPEYNICKKAGSRLGTFHSLEVKTKMSIARMGNKYCLGKTRPQEVKDKIAKTLLGVTFTEERKNKISKALKGNKNALGSKSKLKIRESLRLDIFRAMQTLDISQKECAGMFKVSQMTVSRILKEYKDVI